MTTRFVTSQDGTRIAVRLEGNESQPPLITIPPWATVDRPADIVGSDTLARHRHRRYWITYDRRGTGASQRDVADVSIDAQVADLEAIRSALAIESWDVTGYFEGGAIAIAFGARNPERMRRLVLWQPFVLGRDFLPPDRIRSLIAITQSDWPLATRTLANLWVPRGPVETQRTLARGFRERLSPVTMVRYLEQYLTVDVRDEAQRITAETLVLHPAGAGIPIRAPQDVAALIPNAVLETVEQSASFVASEAVAGRMIDFLDAVKSASPSTSQANAAGTAIILLTDIADSTALTEHMGDTAFRAKARELDAALRERVRANGGSVIEAKTLGDGVLATFPSASQAIAAALSFDSVAAGIGLGLHIGLHAGDVIREDGNVFGGAVNIAARISALAPPGEVFVSRTVADLARTSASVTFEDRGEHTLKGVGEPQRVFAVRAPAR